MGMAPGDEGQGGAKSACQTMVAIRCDSFGMNVFGVSHVASFYELL